MTATRSPSRNASSMSCVTSTTVVPKRLWIASRSSCALPRMIGSSAPNGSSMSSTAGSAASARANARALPAEQLRYGRDVLGHGPVWKQAMALNHLADFAPQERRGRRRGIAPVDAHDPARGLDELVDHAQQRRLAAARGADDHRDRAARNRHRYVIDDGRRPILL